MLGSLAGAVLLAGCGGKQSSEITVLSNDRSATVAAQPACAVLGSCGLVASKETRISAAAGSQIQLTVPNDLAKAGWIVAAYTTDGTKNTPVSTPGASTGTLVGTRTARLAVPQATEGSYFLQVTALRPSNQLTTWLVGVQLTK